MKSVSFEFIVPLSHRGWNGRYYRSRAKTNMLIFMNTVGPRLLRHHAHSFAQGREFSWNDTKASGLKIILNQSAAKQFFPGQNAVGRQM